MTIYERYLMACNPDTPVAELYSLAVEETSSSVRIGLAENPCTPLPVLLALANEQDPEVRSAVAANPAAPFRLLLKLAADPDPTVRFSMAEEIRLPISLLKVLAGDQNPYVQARALRTLSVLELELALNQAGFKPEMDEAYKLGALLVRAGCISKRTLAELLRSDECSNTPLGHLLLLRKILPVATITRALLLQSRLRRREITEDEAMSELRSE